MAINFPYNIQLNDNLPLDTRYVVDNAAERLAIEYPYEGLIVFERDTKDLYVSYLHNDTFKWYLINTNKDSLFIRGYYFNGKFWATSEYQEELPKVTTRFYIDNSSLTFYAYQPDEGFVPVTPTATELAPGIMKLYGTHGQNIDGTMTQKAITDGVNAISLELENIGDEDNDGKDDFALILDLPWD